MLKTLLSGVGLAALVIAGVTLVEQTLLRK